MQNFKLTFILAISVVLCQLSFSVTANDKGEFNKLISKYDVSEVVKRIPKDNPQQFWITLLNTNEIFLDYEYKYQINRGAAKKANEMIFELPKFYPQYDENIIDSLDNFCDSLLIELGMKPNSLNNIFSLHVYSSTEQNAFTVLTEDGFAICLTTGLLKLRPITHEMLLGFIAHEFAHGILKHHIRQCYEDIKNSRKTKVLGGLSIAMNATADVANQYSSALSGTDYESSLDNDISNITERMSKGIQLFRLKFSREEEFEADLIAYRFMENIGLADEYINALRAIGHSSDIYYNNYSDHPKIQSRINFLNYVKAHPELGNTINLDMRKERLLREAAEN